MTRAFWIGLIIAILTFAAWQARAGQCQTQCFRQWDGGNVCYTNCW